MAMARLRRHFEPRRAPEGAEVVRREVPGEEEEGGEAVVVVVELRAPVVAAITMTMTMTMMMMMTAVVRAGVEAESEAGPPRVVEAAPQLLEVGQRGAAEVQGVAAGMSRDLPHDHGSERRPMVSDCASLQW
jgi:hypothetical protein